jgi:hypothetical protein
VKNKKTVVQKREEADSEWRKRSGGVAAGNDGTLAIGTAPIKVGLVVCPSTNPINSYTRIVSSGSPPSTKILV